MKSLNEFTEHVVSIIHQSQPDLIFITNKGIRDALDSARELQEFYTENASNIADTAIGLFQPYLELIGLLSSATTALFEHFIYNQVEDTTSVDWALGMLYHALSDDLIVYRKLQAEGNATQARMVSRHMIEIMDLIICCIADNNIAEYYAKHRQDKKEGFKFIPYHPGKTTVKVNGIFKKIKPNCQGLVPYVQEYRTSLYGVASDDVHPSFRSILISTFCEPYGQEVGDLKSHSMGGELRKGVEKEIWSVCNFVSHYLEVIELQFNSSHGVELKSLSDMTKIYFIDRLLSKTFCKLLDIKEEGSDGDKSKS